jgi:putrescine transport system substrate-binding protein
MSAYAFRAARFLGLLLLAGCAADTDSVHGPVAGADERIVNVYNWNDYIGKSTIADFEAKTGIKVVYDTYDSNEILETKLLTGHSGYDVAFPTATIVGRLARAGALMQLDKSLLTNLGNIAPEAMRTVAVNDPGNAHSVAYMTGTIGLGYNPELVQKALGTRRLDSWAAVFDPAIASKLAECGITLLDSPEDVFDAAEFYLGTDTGNESLQELAAAEQLVRAVRPYVRSFDTTQHLNALAAGDICVSLSWTNLVLQARYRGTEAARPVEITYVIPKEGSSQWFDTMAIPANAPHVANAHALIDFLMEPEVIAAISNDIGCANGNGASVPFLRPELKDDPSITPNADVQARLRPSYARSQAYSREVNRAWTRIKTGQ